MKKLIIIGAILLSFNLSIACEPPGDDDDDDASPSISVDLPGPGDADHILRHAPECTLIDWLQNNCETPYVPGG